MKSNSSRNVMAATPRRAKNSGNHRTIKGQNRADLRVRTGTGPTIDIAAVLAQEVQGVRMVVFHRLRHVDDISISAVVPATGSELGQRSPTGARWIGSVPLTAC